MSKLADHFDTFKMRVMTDESQRLKCAKDRGAADSYYRRIKSPHMIFSVNSTGGHELRGSIGIRFETLTPEEIAAYNQGYNDNEELGYYKEW
jgi:hypothetical protein